MQQPQQNLLFPPFFFTKIENCLPSIVKPTKKLEPKLDRIFVTPSSVQIKNGIVITHELRNRHLSHRNVLSHPRLQTPSKVLGDALQRVQLGEGGSGR